MFMVRAWASHADHEAGREAAHLTFAELADAERWRAAVPYPIVSVRNIGRDGYCPVESTRHERILGHTFAGKPWTCEACGALSDDVYIPGTGIPRPPDVEPGDLCPDCDRTADEHDRRNGDLCPDGQRRLRLQAAGPEG